MTDQPDAGPDDDVGTDAPDDSRTGTGRGRLSFWLGLTLLGVLVVGGVWIVLTALLVRSDLNRVRQDLPKLRAAVAAGDITRAESISGDIRSAAHSAHGWSSGPAWWIGANLPGLGSPLRTVRVLAAQSDRVGQHVVPQVVSLVDQVLTTAHLSGGRIDLAKLRTAGPALDSAAAVAQSATGAVRAAPASWFGPVSSARTSMADALARVDGELGGASRALHIALPMLGGSGQKRYFIGFLNEAESRGLGGIPGSFAIATIDDGKVAFTHFGSDNDLKGVRAKVNLGAEFNARYAQDDPTGVFQNSDLSPNFPYAARIWAGTWQAKTGQHVDGAIAIDPTALSYLLRATGPVTTTSGTVVSAGDVVALTQQTQYRLYPHNTPADNTARKTYLTGIAQAVAHRLTSNGGGAELVRAAAKSAGQRRLVLWSAQPSVESQLVESGWSGALDPDGGPFSGFVVNNAAGSKLDYYLDRTMTYERTSCAANATAVATIRLTNDAPAQGLPPYVTIRADKAPAGVHPGDNRLLVTYYGSPGATIKSVSLDGTQVVLAPVPEDGLVTVTTDLELPVGATRTMTVTLAEPAVHQSVSLLVQPLVRPMTARVTDSCN